MVLNRRNKLVVLLLTRPRYGPDGHLELSEQQGGIVRGLWIVFDHRALHQKRDETVSLAADVFGESQAVQARTERRDQRLVARIAEPLAFAEMPRMKRRSMLAYVRFAGPLVTGSPRERGDYVIDGAQARLESSTTGEGYWIEIKGRDLGSVRAIFDAIAQGTLLPVASWERPHVALREPPVIPKTFELEANYGLPLNSMLVEAGCDVLELDELSTDRMESDGCGGYFGLGEYEGVKTSQATLLNLGRAVAGDEIGPQLEVDGIWYEPAHLYDLLVFAKMYPAAQLHFPICALASGWTAEEPEEGERDSCPELTVVDGKRVLRPRPQYPAWSADVRFLFVKRSDDYYEDTEEADDEESEQVGAVTPPSSATGRSSSVVWPTHPHHEGRRIVLCACVRAKEGDSRIFFVTREGLEEIKGGSSSPVPLFDCQRTTGTSPQQLACSVMVVVRELLPDALEIIEDRTLPDAEEG